MHKGRKKSGNFNLPEELRGYRLPEDGREELHYFKNTPACHWTFDKFFTSGSYKSALHKYNSCLSLLLESRDMPSELRSFVGRLKVSKIIFLE